MDNKRLRDITSIRKEEFDSEEVKLLTTDFYKLNLVDRNKSLDLRMKLHDGDLITEEEVCDMFQQFDSLERYADMLLYVTFHTKLLGEFFDETYDYHKYNFQHKWDKSIDTFSFVTMDQWLGDLKNISRELSKYNKLKILIIDKILKRYGIEPVS